MFCTEEGDVEPADHDGDKGDHEGVRAGHLWVVHEGVPVVGLTSENGNVSSRKKPHHTEYLKREESPQKERDMIDGFKSGSMIFVNFFHLEKPKRSAASRYSLFID